MERNEQVYDRIERYLLGEMPLQERQSFEQDIANDEALRALVNRQRLELDTIDILLEEDLREQMQNWKEEEKGNNVIPESSSRRLLYRISIGLAIILVLIIIFMITRSSDELGSDQLEQEQKPVIEAPKEPEVPERPVAEVDVPKPAETPAASPREEPRQPAVDYLALATENYELPQDLRGNLRTAGQTETSPLDAGLAAFETQDYPTTILELGQLTPEIGEDAYARAQEVLGHAYFLNQQYFKAAELFEKMTRDPDFESVRQYGEWYLTLSLLPRFSENESRVRALLDKMIDPDHFHNYRAKAEKLRKDLML